MQKSVFPIKIESKGKKRSKQQILILNFLNGEHRNQVKFIAWIKKNLLQLPAVTRLQ